MTIWSKNTNYYIELPIETLSEIIDDMLKSMIGYDMDKELKYEDITRSVKYLLNGNIATNIQCVNPNYMLERCVLDFITSEDFDLAKYYFQTDKFLTQQEYLDLEPIINE